ncbi:MAG: TnpV protein [Clostridiales bacterium]|nr:TnpV protein [Clostridiales bacterium]
MRGPLRFCERVRILCAETLFPHLPDIEAAATRRIEEILPALMKDAGITESLKAADPMKWVGLMNTCHAQAEEIVLAELIYN